MTKAAVPARKPVPARKTAPAQHAVAAQAAAAQQVTPAQPAAPAQQVTPAQQGVPPMKGFAVTFPPTNGGLSRGAVEELRAAIDDDKMVDGRIGHDPKGLKQDPQVRDAQVQWVSHEGLDPSICAQLLTLAVVTNEEQGWRFELDGIARFLQFTRYAAGGQHYDWHLDWGGGRTQFRKISLVVHLSDPAEFTGGSLQVTWGARPFETTPPAGTVTVFPSFMMHRVTPVTAGTRSAAVAWVMGPSFR